MRLQHLNVFRTERPTGRKFGVLALLGLTLIPALLAASFQWTQADATANPQRLEAAVVNLDRPVTIEGRFTPLGRLLVMRLTDHETSPVDITWTNTDQEDAADGLSSGRYATVVTIPGSFSADATSPAALDPDKVRPAVLDVRASTRAGVIDPTVGLAVSSTITSALNTELATEYVQNIFMRFGDLKRDLGKAADGSGRLAGGLDQAYDGSLELVDGLDQLAVGTDKVADGNEKLARGLGSAADKVKQLPGATQQLADAGHLLADGLNELNDGTSGYKGDLLEIIRLVKQLNAQTGPQQHQLEQLMAQLQQLDQAVEQAVAQCRAPEVAETEPCRSVLVVHGAVGQVRSDLGIEDTGRLLSQLLSASKDLDSQLGQATRLVDGIQKLAWGSSKLAGGLDRLNGQMPALVDGMVMAADGSRRLAGGARQVADGAALAASRAGELPDGLDQLRDGAYQLHDGLADGARQLPSYTKEEARDLAGAMAAPVKPLSPTLPDPDLSAGYFTALALAVAGLVIFMLIRAVPEHAVSSSRNAFRLALQSYWPALVLAGLQTLVIAGALQVAMDLPLGRLSAFAGVVLLAAASMYAVGQALVAALGGAGRFLAILAIAVSAPTAMVSTTPEALQVLVDLTPIAPTIDALRGIITGADIGREVTTLVAWLVAGIAVTVASITRDRNVRVRSLVHA